MLPAHSLLRDLRFAVSSLRRSPGFTLVAIVTLGLGIGANTSMFSVLSGYMLRPPPYPDAGRLERIYRATEADPDGGIPPADYLDATRELRGYGRIAAYSVSEMNLSEPGRAAEMSAGLRVSANLFGVLGAGPVAGRGFRPDEEVRGNHRVLVISHRFWQRRFAGDPRVIGRTLRVDGEVHQVVGVLPEDFSDWRHLNQFDLLRPLALDQKESRDRGTPAIRLVGRRAPGVSAEEAAAMVAAFGQRLEARHPTEAAGTTWRTLALGRSFLPFYGQIIIAMLVGLSGFVLLIACSNLANLLLVRTMARAREFAVRSALGASRWQVIRPLWLESLLLALLGGGVALIVSQWAFTWMEARSRGEDGLGFDLVFDWRVLGWAFGACLFTAMAFGVVPALFALRLDPNRILRGGARGNTGGRGLHRFRNLLIVGQLSLAMVLLAGAVLFIRGLDELNTRRTGWESSGMVTGTIQLSASAYATPRAIADFQRRVAERLEALPGVAAASVSYAMPFLEFGESRRYRVDGRPEPRPGQEPSASVNGVGPHYFETVGTALLRGRAFTDADDLDAPRVFVISRSMAEDLFPGQEAVGRRIAWAGGDGVVWGQIVGVAADIESVVPEKAPVRHQVYLPIAQEPRAFAEIAVRAEGVPPAALVEGIRGAMMGLDPDLPVRRLRPAELAIARANYGIGVLRSILSALGLLGLGLATLGIYGVIARSVAQRSGEFGIRLALGAVAGDITRMVLASGARLAVVGSALGLVGSLGVARLSAAAFPNMHTDIRLAMAGIAGLLVATALLACYLPSRRVSRINPADALQTM